MQSANESVNIEGGGMAEDGPQITAVGYFKLLLALERAYAQIHVLTATLEKGRRFAKEGEAELAKFKRMYDG